jgi:LmbE family N-acetylglucosaminyl deacetylase
MPARALLPPAVAVALLLGLAMLGIFGTPAGTDASPAPLTSAAAGGLPIAPGSTLLVVSPHPDDESLCCAGVIQQALKAGARVAIVWITSGDGSRIDTLLLQGSLLPSPGRFQALGTRRMQEARAASASLGVAADQQLFLGYPDGGLARLMAGSSTLPLRSPTSGADHVPYKDALFPGHPYTRQSLQQDFAAVLDRVHPTLVLAPDIDDDHPDHRAAGLLTLATLAQRRTAPVVRFWVVHGRRGWPSPRGLLAPLPLTPPVHGRRLLPITLPLDAEEEAGKLRAIRLYHSQMHVMAPFLLAFVRTNEIFFRQVQEAPPLHPATPLPAHLRSP